MESEPADPPEPSPAFRLEGLPGSAVCEILAALTPADKKSLRAVSTTVKSLVDERVLAVTTPEALDDAAAFSALLQDCQVPTTELIQALLSAQLPALEELEFRLNTRVGPRDSLKFIHANDAARLAAAAPQWPALRALRFPGCCLSDAVVRELLQADGWPRLEELDLSNQLLSTEAGASLAAAAPRLPSLRRLLLKSNNLRQEGVEELVRASWPRLEGLDVRWNDLGPAGEAVLQAAAALWPVLRVNRGSIFLQEIEKIRCARIRLERLMLGLDPMAEGP